MRKVILGLAIAVVAWGPASLASADAAGDRAAAQQIAQNMKQSGQLRDYRVGVKFQNGVAWLMGSVTSAQQKAIAERIARETDGVERVVSKLEVTGDKATVTREVDAGLETLEVDLPAVVTTDLRLNEPRFIKLPDIMKAKSKPMETLQLSELGVASGDLLKTTSYAPPAKRSKGVMVKTAAELVDALKAKGLL